MSQLKRSKHLKIPLEEIQRATQNFQVMCIGKGGYGMVYKGELIISGKPTPVAIKRLNEQFGQGLKEFLTEIELLSGQKHPNLIRLVGYCDEEKEKIIVYEYADRGSLDVYLRGDTDSTLTWLQRLKICIDAARGLAYLHNHVGDHQAIIHRDIKSSNVLIDENWVAKLSDLGLSKLGLAGLNRSDVVSHPCGTPGYCEPEYIETCIVAKESDVYSFGIVLYEVLCGRLCTNIKVDNGAFISPSSAKDYYLNNSLDEIVDPSLKEEMNLNSMNTFVAIAKKCLHDDRRERPPMHLVVEELEQSLELQLERLKHLKIPLEDIKRATKNFQDCTIKGGYGMDVYKGELVISGKPTTVAIKRLYEQSGRVGFKEFWTEVQLLAGHKHPNLINLLGYCDEEKEKIIIYEYAECRSLDVYLRGADTLTWLQRLKICVDAARGLDYLHNHVGNHQAIIRREIKSSNILVDDNWVAKYSHPCGTFSNLEPEYRTKEHDIYSFGIVLYEVFCGRVCDNIIDDDGFLFLPFSGKYYYNLDEIVDPSLKGEMNLWRFALIAMRCLRDDRVDPLPMHQVVKELEEALALQKPQRLHSKPYVLNRNPREELDHETYIMRFQYKKVVAEIKAARCAVKAHKLGEPTLITCDRHKAWSIFKHFDLDKDGVLNREELEAFIRATHPGIDLLTRSDPGLLIYNDSGRHAHFIEYREFLASNCVYKVYNLYEGYSDGEKGLTFDGFLLSTHTIKFDLDVAIRRLRLDMYLLHNALISGFVVYIMLLVIEKTWMEKVYTFQVLRPLVSTFFSILFGALYATWVFIVISYPGRGIKHVQ